MQDDTTPPEFIVCCSVCHRIKTPDGGWGKAEAIPPTGEKRLISHGYCLACYRDFMKSFNSLRLENEARQHQTP